MMKDYDTFQELQTEERLNKQELLDKAGREFGLEAPITIELYRMDEYNVNYTEMLEYYKLYKAAAAEDFFGFNN